jgi:hypothetical protein
MFRKLACAVAICTVLPMGAAYASGPKYAVHHASEPAVSPDQGRIYFYRESSLAGVMLEPAIKIDGEKVGDSSSGDYFYVDRPPGTYTVSTKTEKDETVSVTLAAGQTVYVKTDVSMGLFVGHVSPELVADDQAASEIADCHFVGSDAPVTAATTPTPAATSTTAAATSPATQPATAPAAPDAPAPVTSPRN